MEQLQLDRLVKAINTFVHTHRGYPYPHPISRKHKEGMKDLAYRMGGQRHMANIRRVANG